MSPEDILKLLIGGANSEEELETFFLKFKSRNKRYK